eukprot:gene8792-8971_t
MQRNPNMPTIEAELESALVKAGAISDQNAGSFQKVVSAKLLIEPPETFAARINQHLPEQIRILGIQRATEGFDARKFCEKRKAEIAASQSRFDFGPEQLAKLNEVLQQYQGTHNFHNYTIRCLATDSSALRYILSFTAELKDIAGQPWVKMVVVGQSFMLHQIRKMVSLMTVAVSFVINITCAPAKLTIRLLNLMQDFNTPMAPELGLFLVRLAVRLVRQVTSLVCQPYRVEAEAFKEARLYPHISKSDSQELINALWLTGLTDSYYNGQLLAAAGVFDGHAGKTTADFAAMHTPQLLHQALTGSGPAMSAAAASLAGFDKWWGARHGRDRSGSTAVLGVIRGRELTVANTGEERLR